MVRISILAGLILGLIIGIFAVDRLVFSQEKDELGMLCDQLNDFKRYEGKKIGYEDTISPSWEIGAEIVAYGQEAIPYLLDIYNNSDNIIAQLFAARLIGEIDYDRGVRLLENYRDNMLTIETIFDKSMASLTIADVAIKELLILEEQKKKFESTQDHIKSDI